MDIKETLAKHQEWLLGSSKGRCADLSYADLSYADLSYADLSYANLSRANLSRANLKGADLSYANLSYADLSSANLRGANLRGANLSYADLSYADLSYANLKGADLSYANLRDTIGNGREIKSLQIGTYNISYTKDIISIGCKTYTLEQWKNFTDVEIDNMNSEALKWWKLNKELIITLVKREI